MPRVILVAVVMVLAIPSSAASLRGFEGQFRGAAAATRTAQAADAVIRHDDSDGSLVKLTVLLLAAPFAMSHDMKPEGYSRGLYADGAGDMGDSTSQHRLELGYHRVASYIDGWSGRWRLDTERHVGVEAFWTDYIEHRDEDLHYVGAAAHGDFWRAQARLSWRALIGPMKNLAGPELALIVRL
ncbi:MAG: hypothetical protein HYX59_05780 [Elusimicrobia bacterium]|nr:hypothetical protein [Elusimicrobiota bacterium]